jgi:DHA1 family multidrug resistance protein-like MFS transporter
VAGLTVWRFVHEDFVPPAPDEENAGGGFWDGVKLVIQDRSLLSIFGIRLIVRSAARLMMPVLPLFIQSLAPTSARIASLTGLISGVRAATGAFGAVTLGRASDRLGYRRVLLICATTVAILYLPQFFVTTPWQLLVLQGALGLVMSGVLASISALLANLAPKGHQGAVYGVDASIVSGANAVGPMLGASVAATWGLRAPFLLASATFWTATLLAWFLIPKDSQRESPATSE